METNSLPASLAPSGDIGDTQFNADAAPSRPVTTPDTDTSTASAPVESGEPKGIADIAPSLMPTGDVPTLNRGPDGKFVARTKGAETKPGADYAKIDDNAAADAGAESRTTPDPANDTADSTPESWDETFAKTFGVPVERAADAAKIVADDFGRVMSDFQAGKYNQQSPAAGESVAAGPSRPSAGQPQGSTTQPSPQAPEAGATAPGLERYTDAEIKAYYDAFDADTAKVMEEQARRYNALVAAVAKSNHSTEQAQALIQAERERVRAEEKAASQARYYQKEIAPFFGEIGTRFPRLSKTFGTGANATAAQREMQGAVLRAAGTYQDIKAREGKQITDRQALEAAVRNLFSEEFEKEQKATDRRNTNIQNRHRNRDIGAGPGGGGSRLAGVTLEDVAAGWMRGKEQQNR